MTKLVLFGDSWPKGVWTTKGVELVRLHHGLSEYLTNAGYNVANMARGGSGLWEILYCVFTYLNFNHSYFKQEDVKIIIFQTDAARSSAADLFDVDYDAIINDSDNADDFYTRTLEIFYIKLNEFAKQFNTKIYLSGGLTDLNLKLFANNNFTNLVVLCESWVKLLYPDHSPSMIPLAIYPDAVHDMIKKNHTKMVDELFAISDKNFPILMSVLASECFGKEFGHYHPNLLGHNIMGKHIDEFFKKENNA